MNIGETDAGKDFGSSQQEIKEDSIGVIPVIKEHVEVGKKVVEKAKVRLSKRVNETVESYDVPLTEEEIVVKRVQKNELVDTPPAAVRYEGDVMIIPVLKEVAVIEKRIMLVEEIHVAKYKYDKTETRRVVVRNEEVNVVRTEINNPNK
jgi:uncharacterized protein (TIGR02271 family)